jgi:O-6-methylguanine DNA methyltransferase
MAPSISLTAVVAKTAMGWAGVALSQAGIRHATLFHKTEDAARGELRAFGAESWNDDRAESIASLLIGYAAGETVSLDDYPVDLPPSTAIQRTTWLGLRAIPRGETRTYGWLTKYTGQPPGAARATGAMCGSNPVPLWLPCHRVVATDGSLHGFGGGLAMKRQLLELEGALPKSLF